MTHRSNRHAAIKEPFQTIPSLHETMLGVKERVEVLSGHRGRVLDAAVTWGDLVDLGLIAHDQVPLKFD